MNPFLKGLLDELKKSAAIPILDISKAFHQQAKLRSAAAIGKGTWKHIWSGSLKRPWVE